MAFIYLIENIINNKKYVGQTTTTLGRRWSRHKTDAKSLDRPLYRAIRKYGLENFKLSILEELDCSFLDEKEMFWINHYSSTDPNFGYNLDQGGNKYKNVSLETREKLTASHIGNKNAMFGKHHTTESKKLISNSKIGKMVGENHPRSKLSNNDVMNIRQLYSSGDYSYKDIALIFNVGKSTIVNIVKHLTYRNI